MKTNLLLLTVATVLLTTSCTTMHRFESRVDVELIETVYRYLIDNHKHSEPIFLSMGFDPQRKVYINPPSAVFVHLADIGLKLRPATEVERTEVGVVEKESGKQAMLFFVDIKQRSRDGVLLECGHYRNMEDASGEMFMAILSEGRWKLLPVGGMRLAQGRSNLKCSALTMQIKYPVFTDAEKIADSSATHCK